MASQSIKNTALLVFACDRYQLLFEGFIYLFKKYWPEEIQFPKYFATEKLHADLNPFRNLQSGEGEWTERLSTILRQIPEEYVLFFQEDMWLSKKPDVKVLIQCVKFVEENDIALLKLHSSEVYVTRGTGRHFNGLQLAELNKLESSYLMSHQVSIWRKSFLLNQLKKKEHPWRNERRGSKRLSKSKEPIYQIDLLAENGKPPVNKNIDTDKRGIYYTVSVNATLHPKTEPLLEIMKRDKPTYAETLKKHMENGITHDGLSHPRKIDIFKKLKNRFQSGN